MNDKQEDKGCSKRGVLAKGPQRNGSQQGCQGDLILTAVMCT